MLIWLAVVVQFLVVRLFVRLRWIRTRWIPAELTSGLHVGRTVLLGTLKMILMLVRLSDSTRSRVLARALRARSTLRLSFCGGGLTAVHGFH